MGLLDDAIREHLELKRLRGADPGEVAREERAALNPVTSDEGSEPTERLADDDGSEPSGDHDHADAVDPPEPPPEHPIQETAEIDMRTVLEAIDSDEDTPRPRPEG